MRGKAYAAAVEMGKRVIRKVLFIKSLNQVQHNACNLQVEDTDGFNDIENQETVGTR